MTPFDRPLVERIGVDLVELRKSGLSVLLLSGAILAFVGLMSISTVPSSNVVYPDRLYYINVLEHFIGMFCIASAFVFQFGDRIDMPYMPATTPPFSVPTAFYLAGVIFSMFAVGLFSDRGLGLLFSKLADVMLVVVLLPLVAYLMALYAAPPTQS